MHSQYKNHTELRLLCWNHALKRRAFRGIINLSGEMDFPAGTLKTEKSLSNAIPYK